MSLHEILLKLGREVEFKESLTGINRKQKESGLHYLVNKYHKEILQTTLQPKT
ncbi:hypothetical protein TM902_180054 [Tenacibaculum maritimum]|uniref:hypothetical protein n=1 Tax=Tenacibaculum maritimum TaxID=107401 RepID=UPI0012E4E438|nr:hypothetical protein [Tenacibaculum maritimum]MCD9582297.1 hypothetical protein [Tenacibaculum maritimum]MCD9636679.1 hypothetical protein [Tenacibaculum maritimum]CAA0144770.1 hypothetical protein TM902_180054 [Tenacibaculum maritimum]